MEDVLKIIADLKKSHQESNKPFNIFTMLLKKDSEAYLHSSFLSWLLDPNPKAPHGLGVLPMRLFLERIGSKHHEAVNAKTTRITPNSLNKTEKGDIDILIEDEKQNFAIIIENKIYAGDSNSHSTYGQLQKYFWQVHNGKLLKNKNNEEDTEQTFYAYYDESKIEVFYLTPDGHEPSLDSTSKADDLRLEISDEVGGKKVKLISYMNHVLPWLKELLHKEEVIRNTYVHEIIAQYIDVVISISCDIERNNALFELVSNFTLNQLGQLKEIIKKYELEKDITKRYERIVTEEQDNAETIDFILNNIKHIYWHSIASFMDNLGNELRQLNIEVEGRSSHLAITDLLYHPNKHTPIYFRIKQNGIVWTLQADDRCREKGFFLGVDTKQKGLSFNNHENQDNGWYFRRYYPGESLNLFNFPFNLLNKTEREKIARQYAAFVKQELKNLEEVNS